MFDKNLNSFLWSFLTFQFGCEKPGPIRVGVRVWATAYRATCVGREDWFAAAACGNPHTGGEFGWCERMKPMTWWWFQISFLFFFFIPLLGGMILIWLYSICIYSIHIIFQLGWNHLLDDHRRWRCGICSLQEAKGLTDRLAELDSHIYRFRSWALHCMHVSCCILFLKP